MSKIIAFEPQEENFKILQSKFANNAKFMLLNAGAWSKDGELYLSGSGTSGVVSETSTNSKDETKIKSRSIDGLNLAEKVTFIKADIEGAEIEMLKGAEKTILRDKPKLAISIYHSNEDMIQIAEYIRCLCPEYKLYVRQHFPCYFWETVLYAQM